MYKFKVNHKLELENGKLIYNTCFTELTDIVVVADKDKMCKEMLEEGIDMCGIEKEGVYIYGDVSDNWALVDYELYFKIVEFIKEIEKDI